MMKHLPYIKIGRKKMRLRLRHAVLPLAAWGAFSLMASFSNDSNAQPRNVIKVEHEATQNDISPAVEIATAHLPVAPSADDISLENVFANESPITTEDQEALFHSVSATLADLDIGGKALSDTEQDFETLFASNVETTVDQLANIEPAAGTMRSLGGIAIPQKRPEQNKFIPAGFQAGDFARELEAMDTNHLSMREVTVRSGDTLMNILSKRAGIDYNDAYTAVKQIKPAYSPQDLRPGHKITSLFYTTRETGQTHFVGLKIETDPIETLYVKRTALNGYEYGKVQKALERTLRVAHGTINSSLYNEASRQNVPDRVILELIRTYSWAVDFQRDLRQGDQFEIMYEEYQTVDGAKVKGRGNILYANLRLGDNDSPIYRFERNNGDVDFYEADGSSIRKTLMKTPIDGARLSSGFGYRKHPVLGYRKKHKGLDFAAPSGTPIYAAGDGVIEIMGRKGAYGNYVRIRHNHGLKTAYAHLKGFKRGLSSGKRVKQGQVIGYVGTTGRSTGPHLHYEVLMNGTQVNPRTVKLPQGHKLNKDEMDMFQGLVAQTQYELENLGVETTVAKNM